MSNCLVSPLQTSLARRRLFSSFKSKSLDLLGSSGIPQRMLKRSEMDLEDPSNTAKVEPLGVSSLAAAHPAATGKTADRRRHLFRRKKDHFASSSYDSSSQSRSSSVESQSSSVQRGLESVLKASTLFAWSSIESSYHTNNQPSFIECKSSHLNSAISICSASITRRRSRWDSPSHWSVILHLIYPP